jgi:hypothetical protein
MNTTPTTHLFRHRDPVGYCHSREGGNLPANNNEKDKGDSRVPRLRGDGNDSPGVVILCLQRESNKCIKMEFKIKRVKKEM